MTVPAVPSPSLRRVVLVDDNELTLPGFAAALDGAPGVELVAAIDHEQALRWDSQWRDVDAVILDAADESRGGDQFPGVTVVRRIRGATTDHRPLVIVVTGHYLHDGLRHRMAMADADFFFLRSELRTADQLLDVVLHPEHHRRGVPPVGDGERSDLLGIDESVDVEALVAYVSDHGLERAFDPDEPVRDDVRSRRWLRHRQGMAEAGRISAVNMTTGTPPRGQSTPSIRQLRRVWAWAARLKRERD